MALPARALAVGAVAVTVVVASLALGLFGAAFGASAPARGSAPSVAAALEAAAAVPNPYPIDMPASLALGQGSFTSTAFGHGSAALYNPVAAAFSPSGDLWVVDRGNNRVLEYVPPFTTGMAATVALGQVSLATDASATTRAGLFGPSGVTVGPGGDVWVADSFNKRVLEYVPPFTTGMDASLVLGQATFTASTPAATASGLDYPNSFAFSSSGAHFVVDYASNRVVEYVPPFANGMNATLALGQTNLTSDSTGTSATTLRGPIGLAIDAAGDLFVGDNENNRVAEYRAPLSTGMAVSLVLGQANFTTRTSATTATGMEYPAEVALDSRGDLWVADWGNSRALEFVPPFADGMAASVVLGQATFTSSTASATSTGLDNPYGIALDSQGNVWVVDDGQNRVLEYVPAEFTVQFVEGGLPYQTNWSVTFGGTAYWSTTDSFSFPAENGSYGFSVGSVGGYSVSSGSGTILVNGTAASFLVVFTPTSTSATPSVFWQVLISVLGVLVIIDTALVVMLLNRGRRPTARPPPQAVEPAAPPAAAGGPSPPTR